MADKEKDKDLTTAKLPPRAPQRRPSATASGVYVVLKGINYGDPEKRVKPGQEVSDLPAESVGWLLSCGAIKRKEGK